MAYMLKSAPSMGLMGKASATSRRSVLARSGAEKPKEPTKIENIPQSERMFSDQEWDNAVKTASTSAAPSAPKAVSVGEAFAFAGPLPEKANGRLAMLGFAAALGAELSTGEPVLTQLGDAPAAIAATFVAFTVASLIPMLKGANPEEALGPFTPAVEKTNGRFAMIGFASLLAYEALQGTALF